VKDILDIVAFRNRVINAVSGGKALLALFALPEHVLCAVLGDREKRSAETLFAAVEGDEYPSLTPQCPQAHMFEREIAEQYDIAPLGHPWLKPVRFHRPYRAGAKVFAETGPAVCDFFRVEGAEIHEVAVGPVHAGIIEPGHFRFQCYGENVLHLDIALGFQHRGAERALVSNPKRRIFYMETLAGDTTIGHTLAYCRNIESLGGMQISESAEAARAVALELERLANHAGDLGALAGDIGYLPTMSFCGRLRGDFLNMTALLCGSRFGRGLLRGGGLRRPVTKEIADELLSRLIAAEADLKNAVELLWNTPSVLARFENTGVISAENAVALGLAGPCARACGLGIDARKDFPSGIYLKREFEPAVCATGDVYARAMTRWIECRDSIALIKEILPAAVCGPEPEAKPALAPDSLSVSVEEGWRGEICHIARTDARGQLDFYKVVDPSFRNWPGLALAMRGQQISDFPLCNKSFNLSYCGHDL